MTAELIDSPPVDYFAGSVPALASVWQCENCGDYLVPLNIGRIVAGKEAVSIMRCPLCAREYRVYMAISAHIATEGDRHNRRKSVRV